ncbi:ATP-binding cassette domain-containing protein [Actinomyces qiguomingii]|uniref:ATP-binding cassette domain-containing protein n=1 Tax=Actinomyces qiguomingii TaxID=2057800 RepID=UPI000CA01B25|nr:ABC transporter ATP-binding protein [Actinomyces qiguomingii]
MGAIEVRDLFKYYKGSSYPALRGIDLILDTGEVLGLTGHNGAGKSTLMGVINGSLAMSSGVVRFDGVDLTPMLARRCTATMDQMHAPLKGVTPSSAIRVAAEIRGASQSAADRITNTLLEYFEISEYADVRSEELSGGVRRLVAFCMCECQGARTSLLDEPTNDVDPRRRKLLWSYIREQATGGRSYIVSTHNVGEVSQYTDHQVVLSNGSVVYDGSSLSRASSHGNNVYVDVQGSCKLEALVGKLGFDRVRLHGNQLVVPRQHVERVIGLLMDDGEEGRNTVIQISRTPGFEALYDELARGEDYHGH